MSRVIVVGAGPAGLVSAITLARYGVPTLVLERRAGPSPFPRATGISLRSMELFRSWGLDPAIRAGDMGVITSGWVGRTLADPDGFPAPLGFASPDQSAELSPTTPVAAPQDHLEPILLEHLRGYPGARIRFGAEVVSIEQDATGVTVTVRADGAVERLRAAHVIGADGAHSAVRRAVGIPMDGPDDLGAHATALFHAPLAAVLGPRRYALFMLNPGAGPLTVMLPADRTDRWLYARQWSPQSETMPDEAAFVDLIRAGAGVPDLPVRITRTGSFTFAAQVARRYREGRVFLVGDAAHRMTPRGGTGMNTAIHDAFDLGWRLGWVHRGWTGPGTIHSGEALLDGYEAQRRPVGIRNVERSAQPGPRDASADHLDDLGDRIPHHWTVRDGQRMSTLDLIGPGLTLLTGPAGLRWAQAVTGGEPGAPVAVHGVDAATAEALGIDRDGALLVRPDAVPA